MDFPPSKSGDVTNYGNDCWSNFGRTSEDVYATQFQGMAYFLDFTNNSSYYLNFGVEFTGVALVHTNGISTAISYGGALENDGANSLSSLKLTSFDGGPAAASGQNYSGLDQID